MKKSTLLCLLLILLVLSACGAAVYARPEVKEGRVLASDDSWRFNKDVLQPDERARIDFESTGEREENPVIRFSAPILDKVTRQPVVADVYIMDGAEKRDPLPAEIAQANTHHIGVELPGEANGTLVVQAPGYEPFYLHLRYRTYTSKQFTGQVELIPLPKVPVLEMQEAGMGEAGTEVL